MLHFDCMSHLWRVQEALSGCAHSGRQAALCRGGAGDSGGGSGGPARIQRPPEDMADPSWSPLCPAEKRVRTHLDQTHCIWLTAFQQFYFGN